MALLGFENIRKDFFDYVYIILLQQSLTSKEISLANTTGNKSSVFEIVSFLHRKKSSYHDKSLLWSSCNNDKKFMLISKGNFLKEDI